MAKADDLKKSLNLPKRPITTGQEEADKIVEQLHNKEAAVKDEPEEESSRNRKSRSKAKEKAQESGALKRSSIDWPREIYVPMKQLLVELDISVKEYVREVVEKDLKRRGKL